MSFFIRQVKVIAKSCVDEYNISSLSPCYSVHLFLWVFYWLKHFWNPFFDLVLSCAILFLLVSVAERISYFCLSRNVIRPLGSTYFHPIRMTYPIHPGPSFRAAEIGEATKHTPSFSELLHSGQMSYCLLFNSSSSITPPWGKLSNLWTPCVYSLRPRVPSWIWIRQIQYATHRNNS